MKAFTLNKAQQRALKNLYDRTPLYVGHGRKLTSNATDGIVHFHGPVSYREVRKRVVPGFDCAMLEWCGMWIGIEPDGYTHS